MPVYQYKGYRNDGGTAAGIIDAESPKVARVKLRKVGVFPTDMVEQGQATAGPSTSSSGKAAVGIGRSPALSTTDVAMMTRQLATLLVAGLPLVEALGVMVDQTEKKAVKSLMADIREEIRGGSSYSAVLERYPREFSQIYVHMVRAGEASGALDQILFRLAEFLEKQLALIAEGKTNKEIATTLALSDKTVKNYLSNIFQKLHITRRAQAAAVFVKRRM
jgi:general secretion pathway protein F